MYFSIILITYNFFILDQEILNIISSIIYTYYTVFHTTGWNYRVLEREENIREQN